MISLYRCLVPLKVENLLVAGKPISTERDAYQRFLMQTMVTGQAAGAAAALCVKMGITPRELEKQVKKLQEVLVAAGGHIVRDALTANTPAGTAPRCTEE